MGEKRKRDERSVQWEEGGLVGVSASELEPMKSEMGQDRAGGSCYCHSQQPPGPHVLSTSQSWQKLCLSEHLSHTHVHTKENVIYVHYTHTHSYLMASKLKPVDVLFIP